MNIAEIEVTHKVKEKEWKEFLSRSEYATVYHTPEWKKTLEESFGYKPYYLFVKDESDLIVGMLPLFYVKSKLTGNRLSSLPFSHISGPVGDKATKNFLISEAINLYKNLGASYLEIRDRVEDNRFLSKNMFSTYILELNPNIEEVWKQLHKGSVRWAIKKSEKSGVVVDTAKDIESLKEFYDLNCLGKRKIGVPCHPWKFFKNLFRFMNDYISLYVAKYQGDIIGGGIMMHYKDTVIYGYGAAHPSYLKLYPYNAFLWKSIKDACLSRYKYFDLGRAHYNVERGLMDFKRRWGTIEKKLYYSYYSKNKDLKILDMSGLKYRLGTKVIRKMPMPIYKKFSDRIFGSLG